MRYKAICFDIDGTLYPARVMNRRLLCLGLLHPVLAIRYNRGRKAFRLNQGDFEQRVPFRWREAMIVQNRSGKEPQRRFIEEEYRGTYGKIQRLIYGPMERLYARTRSYDGVRSTFERIRAKGLMIGVFTDFPLFDKLGSMGLSNLVDFRASSDDVGFLKPDTHCFEYLLYNLKMEPKDVLYVGDSYSKDVAGAREAGIDAVLVNVSPSKLRDSASRFPLATAVFSRWSDFDAWLAAGMEDVE